MDREDVCTKSKENTTVELGILPITDSPVSTQHNIEVDQINHDDTPTMSNQYETTSQDHIPSQPMGTSKESISSSEAVDSSMNSEEISTNDTEVSNTLIIIILQHAPWLLEVPWEFLNPTRNLPWQ